MGTFEFYLKFKSVREPTDAYSFAFRPSVREDAISVSANANIH